ncbi:MAG: 3-phosphoshikimate 1-carboxyvinyltransferase [Thermodesulfobacteriota bacterium]
MGKIVVRPAISIKGEITVPGDKSISHRAVMLGSLGDGRTEITGILESEDTLRTIEAFRLMGVDIEKTDNATLSILGRGLDGLEEPSDVIDAGNSGTTARILSGLLSGQRFFSVITGDASLRTRPMARVVEPLKMMGAKIWGREEGCLIPLSINGGGLRSVDYESSISSAQVKSAILFAALNADGTTVVKEPIKSRDHTERMLSAFGADIKVEGTRVTVVPGRRLSGQTITIPGDISSAAFFIVASIILSDSTLTIKNVGLNPTRTGIISLLKRMGAKIDIRNERDKGGEPVGDIIIRSGQLKGIDIGAEDIPWMIDEIPILCIAASLAEGRTVIRGAEELRVKESDRIAVMTEELTKLGIRIEEKRDGMVINGAKGFKGASCDSHGDHRVAMALTIAGLKANEESAIENSGCVDTSFPGFQDLLESIVNR